MRTETNSTQKYLVKHKFTRLCIAQNEVAGDVWRQVAPLIPYVRCPVAAVREAPEGGGFGGEGGGGELRTLLPAI